MQCSFYRVFQCILMLGLGENCHFSLFALIFILLFSSCAVSLWENVVHGFINILIWAVFFCIGAELWTSDTVDLTLSCRYRSPRGVLLQVPLQQQIGEKSKDRLVSTADLTVSAGGLSPWRSEAYFCVICPFPHVQRELSLRLRFGEPMV